MNMIVVSAAKDSMRECRELTRVPAFLSEASIADVIEKAGGKIRDSDKTAIKPETEAGIRGTTSLVSPHIEPERRRRLAVGSHPFLSLTPQIVWGRDSSVRSSISR
jgi:hypothetical protein